MISTTTSLQERKWIAEHGRLCEWAQEEGLQVTRSQQQQQQRQQYHIRPVILSSTVIETNKKKQKDRLQEGQRRMLKCLLEDPLSHLPPPRGPTPGIPHAPRRKWEGSRFCFRSFPFFFVPSFLTLEMHLCSLVRSGETFGPHKRFAILPRAVRFLSLSSFLLFFLFCLFLFALILAGSKLARGVGK